MEKIKGITVHRMSQMKLKRKLNPSDEEMEEIKKIVWKLFKKGVDALNDLSY